MEVSRLSATMERKSKYVYKKMLRLQTGSLNVF